MQAAQAWPNAPRRTRSLPRRHMPQRLVVVGVTPHHLGASGPTRFHVDGPLLPGRPWGEFATPHTDELYHGVAEPYRLGPPPLAGRDLHDTRLKKTNHVAKVGSRTSKRCRRLGTAATPRQVNPKLVVHGSSRDQSHVVPLFKPPDHLGPPRLGLLPRPDVDREPPLAIRPIECVRRDPARISVADLLDLIVDAHATPDRLRRVLGVSGLAEVWRREFEDRLVLQRADQACEHRPGFPAAQAFRWTMVPR